MKEIRRRDSITNDKVRQTCNIRLIGEWIITRRRRRDWAVHMAMWNVTGF